MPLLATVFDRWTISSVGSAIRTSSVIDFDLFVGDSKLFSSVDHLGLVDVARVIAE